MIIASSVSHARQRSQQQRQQAAANISVSDTVLVCSSYISMKTTAAVYVPATSYLRSSFLQQYESASGASARIDLNIACIFSSDDDNRTDPDLSPLPLMVMLEPTQTY